MTGATGTLKPVAASAVRVVPWGRLFIVEEYTTCPSGKQAWSIRASDQDQGRMDELKSKLERDTI